MSDTVRAVEATVAAGGKLVFSGVGKSAHVAGKIAATFNSTGVSSCFLDPTQALHGDLGLCYEGDLAILLSNSGQSDEVLRLLPAPKRFGLKIVAFTGNAKSDLARDADHRLIYRVRREACPLKLAPTASTTAALALGDALAMVILRPGPHPRRFRKVPSGRQPRQGPPASRPRHHAKRRPASDGADTVTVQDAILAMTKAKSGSIALVGAKAEGSPVSSQTVISAGPPSRGRASSRGPFREFMTRSPKVIRDDALGVDALRLFELHKIDDLIVVDAAGPARGPHRRPGPPQVQDRVKQPVRVGIIGMGGFAGSHHNTVARLEERGVLRLVCACDPSPARSPPSSWDGDSPQRGVRVFGGYREMLEACHGELDYVAIPTPIRLHAEMHEAVTSYGLPAYLEKPPTLDHEELERMIAADQRARKTSLVGFNFIVEKSRLALKERLLSGEFGSIRGGTLCALWPRPSSYFARNGWSGRLVIDGKIVLDSCFGNTMAPFRPQHALLDGNPGLYSWADIAAVRAELYRAHAIEGADTFFVEADLATGCTLRFALSQACAGASTSSETVICEKAILRYSVGGQIEVSWKDGRSERISSWPFDGLEENHLEYARYLRGEVPRPATTLEDSRPLVILNDLAHISSGRIHPIPADIVTLARDEKEQKDYVSVTGMAKIVDNFLSRGIWPSYAGWRRNNGEVVTPADLPRFHDVVVAMASVK